MNLGVHFARLDDTSYPSNAGTLDLTYLAVKPGDMHYIGNTMKRIEAYAATHPDATIVWRIDYNFNKASFPPAHYNLQNALEPIHWLRHLGNRLCLQFGNEPNIEDHNLSGSNTVVANWWNNFYNIAKEKLPDALVGTVPIATFHPSCLLYTSPSPRD